MAIVVILIVAAGSVLRMHARQIADNAMHPLVIRGWHVDATYLLPFVRGLTCEPVWLFVYQHDEYPSCFPFQVAVSFFGKPLMQPESNTIEIVVASYMKNKKNAEQGDGD